MRRGIGLGAIFALIIQILFPLVPVTAQEPTPENIWNGEVSIEQVEFPADDPAQFQHRRCAPTDFQLVNLKNYTSLAGLRINFNANTSGTAGRVASNVCATKNTFGYFGENYWAPESPKEAARIVLPATDMRTYISPQSGHALSTRNTSSHAAKTLSLIKSYNPLTSSDIGVTGYGSGVDRVAEKTFYVRADKLDMEPVVYANGFTIRIHRNTVDFSEDGKKAVMKIYRQGYVVMDLEAQTITPFQKNTSSTSTTLFSISKDYRYVTTSSGTVLTVYDVDACPSFAKGAFGVAEFDVLPAGCQGIEIGQAIRDACDLFSIGRHRFNYHGNRVLVDARCRLSDGTIEVRRYALNPTAYAQDPQPQGYLALGDSFTSGEGDGQGGTWYEPGTDEQGNKDTFEGRNLCHLSRRSYPYLIAKDLGFLTNLNEPVSAQENGLFHSIACSGAVIHNITGGLDGIAQGSTDNENREYDNQYMPSYFGLLNRWQPGRYKQLDYINQATVAGYTKDSALPEAITIGIGGNDAGFGDIVKACTIDLSTCKYAVAGSDSAANLAATIADLKPGLVETYKQLKQQSDPNTRVYAHGYPRFTQVDGQCALNVRLDAQEVLMVDEGVQYMNAVVRAAALEAGVYYVDVSDILINRNLCSFATDEQMAFNGITAGDDITTNILNFLSADICKIRSGCFGNESFHPNQLGHELYRQAILNQTNSLTAASPSASLQPYPMPSEFFGESVRNVVLNTNLSNGLIRNTIQIENPKPMLSDAGTDGLMKITQSRLLPNSTVKLIVQSDPVVIGEYPVNENGEVEIDFSLPTELESGVHELHLTGRNSYGQAVDYYEPIVIGVAINDFDGDGIMDDVDSCKTIPNSGIDADNDGIDDVCDNQITIIEPEPEPEPETPLHPLCAVLNRVATKLSTKKPQHPLKFLQKNKKYSRTCTTEDSKPNLKQPYSYRVHIHKKAQCLFKQKGNGKFKKPLYGLAILRVGKNYHSNC